MLRRLYDWTMGLAAHRRALPALGLVAFIESSVFPIPPDVMLIPMVLAARKRAWLIASVCTVASVAGGLAGYAIGFFLWQTLGQPLIEFYGYGHEYERFAAAYNDRGAWIVFVFGITFFPYKVITITSGATALGLGPFLLASVIARGLRFAIVAALLYYFGEPIRAFIERYLALLTTLFVALLIGGFVIVRYLV